LRQTVTPFPRLIRVPIDTSVDPTDARKATVRGFGRSGRNLSAHKPFILGEDPKLLAYAAGRADHLPPPTAGSV
jgi:hypothetical protein